MSDYTIQRCGLKDECANLRTKLEEMQKENTLMLSELERYAIFAEKFGDLSCCYDAEDVIAVIQRAFDALKEIPDTQIELLKEQLLRATEGLQAIEADGWIEGGKTHGEFKGMSEEEIARTVLADIKKLSEGDSQS